MKKVTYRKKTGEIVMSDADINNEVLATVEVPDDPRINQGYLMKYINGQIEFTKNHWMENEEEAERKRQEFFDNIAALQNAKTIADFKPLLQKLLTKIT